MTSSQVAGGWWGTSGVAVDGTGSIYLGNNTSSKQILKVSPTGVGTILAGQTTAGYADGNGSAAQFAAPDFGFAVAPTGTIYVSDRTNHCIRTVAQNGDVSTLAGLCGAANSGMVYGIGTAARFNQPAGLALDSAGNLYVADGINCRIRKIDAATNTVSTFAGTSCGFADGDALTVAKFGQVSDLDIDTAGNVYVAQNPWNQSCIRKVTPSGTVTTVAGTCTTPGAGFADGLGGAAKFNTPQGIAVDPSGNLFVVDGNNRIRIINPQGYALTLAGDGTSATTNGTGTAIQFNSPRGIAIDGNGVLYTIEWSSTAGVRKLTL